MKLLFAVIASLSLTISAFAVDDFDVIKKRVVAELMKRPVDDSDVNEILSKMESDGSFRDINYTDLSRTAGFPHRRHTSNLVTLARAYKNKKSKY